MMVGLILGMVTSFLVPSKNTSISVALVDEDQTEETELIKQFLTLSKSQNQSLEISNLTKKEAQKKINHNEISAYIIIQKNFTENLYMGKTVTIPIVGNPSRTVDGIIVKGIVENIKRNIESAQANILTTKHYAKDTAISKEKLDKILLKQFMESIIDNFGKSKIVKEEKMTNISTAKPLHFYILTGWFISFTIWLLGFYIIFENAESNSMKIRLKLFGVTRWRPLLSRMVISLFGSLLFAVILFVVIEKLLELELYLLDYSRIMIFSILYGVILLAGIAFFDVWIKSRKMVLLVQNLYIAIVILLSGSIIPGFYFPLEIQKYLSFVFSYESFNWLVDIILEERNYADFTFLCLISIFSLVVVWGTCTAMERWSR